MEEMEDNYTVGWGCRLIFPLSRQYNEEGICSVADKEENPKIKKYALHPSYTFHTLLKQVANLH